MIIVLEYLGVFLVILVIINGILSISTKIIIKKNGFSTFPFISLISDIKKLRTIIEKDSSYKALYYSYVISSILFGINFIALIIIVMILTN